MHRLETDRLLHTPSAVRAGWRAWCAACWLFFVVLLLPIGALAERAERAEVSGFDVARTDDGLLVDFAVRFDLPAAVEDALLKGVPLYFVAEAEVFRDRWYWRDKRLSRAARVWRVAFQPLTRKYRVTFGGLHQSYDTLADALATVRRVNGWKIADSSQLEDGTGHYVEFRYRLDTTLLPRPMQIGIGGQPEWTLLIEKFYRVN